MQLFTAVSAGNDGAPDRSREISAIRQQLRHRPNPETSNWNRRSWLTVARRFVASRATCCADVRRRIRTSDPQTNYFVLTASNRSGSLASRHQYRRPDLLFLTGHPYVCTDVPTCTYTRPIRRVRETGNWECGVRETTESPDGMLDLSMVVESDPTTSRKSTNAAGTDSTCEGGGADVSQTRWYPSPSDTCISIIPVRFAQVCVCVCKKLCIYIYNFRRISDILRWIPLIQHCQ